VTAKWSENSIAAALARQTFNRNAIVLVPNCIWTGYECDLLVVTKDLRVIDVEVKISRADLKKDAGKSKWWHEKFIGYGPEEVLRDSEGRYMGVRQQSMYDRTPRVWPPKVWKHYYAAPADIWDDSLLECLPSPASGVILLEARTPLHSPPVLAAVARRATPNRDADKLTPAQAIDVARLANLRYWAAAEAAERSDAALAEMLKKNEVATV
jgi:hypothetical protein